MNYLVSLFLLIAATGFCVGPACAQNPDDDQRPLVYIVGDPEPPTHVRMSSDLNATIPVYAFTIYGEARGHSDYAPFPLNKIARFQMRTCKGNSPLPLYNYREGAATSAPDWQFKWKYECGGDFQDESLLKVNDDHTWLVTYYAPGKFWWIGGVQDSWNYSNASIGAWWFYTEPYGPYLAQD